MIIIQSLADFGPLAFALIAATIWLFRVIGQRDHKPAYTPMVIVATGIG